MERVFSVIKYLLYTVFAILFLLYAVSFILLKTPTIQQKVKCVVEEELSSKLTTPVTIKQIIIEPFRKVALYDICIVDQQSDTLLYANKLLAGVKLSPLFHRELVFNNIQLFGFNIQIKKETPSSTPNYQYIIDAFTTEEKKKSTLSVQLNNVVIRRGHISYDILSEPHLADSTLFDKNHIALHDVLSTISIKEMSSDSTNVFVKRLSLKEQSGFDLKRLSFRFASNANGASLSGFDLHLPHSHATLETLYLQPDSSLSCDAMSIQLNLQELAPLLPDVKEADYTLTLTGAIDGSNEHLSLSNIRIANKKNKTLLRGDATLKENRLAPQMLYVNASINNIEIDVAHQDSLLLSALPLSSSIKKQLLQLGTIRGELNTVGYLETMHSTVGITTHMGDVDASMLLGYNTSNKQITCKGEISVKDVALNKLIRNNNMHLGKASARLQIDTQIPSQGYPEGEIKGAFTQLETKGYQFDYITLHAIANNNQYRAEVEIDDPHAYLHLAASLDRSSAMKQLVIEAMGENIEPTAIGLMKEDKGVNLSFDSLYVTLAGTSPLKVEGNLGIEGINIASTDKETVNIKQLHIAVNTLSAPQEITIASDFANGYIKGDYSYRTVANSLQRMIAPILPATIDSTHIKWKERNNEFDFELTIQPQSKINALLELPINLSSECVLAGNYSDKTVQLHTLITLPNMELDSSRFEDGSISINIEKGKASMRAAINHISKNERLSIITLNANAAENWLATQVNWSGNRTATYCGEVRTLTTFTQGEVAGKMPIMHTKIKPTQVILNDLIWNIKPASITVKDRCVAVDSIEIAHDDQYVRLHGIASALNTEEHFLLSLQKINLDYIFDIINSRSIDFGGIATGDFYLSNLFDTPSIQTDSLCITQFAYNDCVLGELTAKSWWQPETKGIWIDGVVSQESYPNSKVLGAIYLKTDSLHFNFDAYHLDAAFIRPFVNTIFNDLSGYIYGKVDLYGTFKALNLVGSPYGQDLTFGIEFLNTTYTTSDSIHFTENSVMINDITMFDSERHTAKARGTLTHKNFKDMKYDFSIYNADNLLVFDVNEEQNPIYYGKAYGSGTANITGNMLRTNIDVSLRTEANTVITFVPNNMLSNNDYPFITFVEHSNQSAVEDSLQFENTKNSNKKLSNEPAKSTMKLNLQVEATPLASVRLLVSPASGDMIKASGSGNLRLAYSTNNDISLYGSYELEKGDYTFNLQDFVSKEFSISEGSTISFKGDPMQADLNINAIYTTTASLLDLDESFADESELTRTSVPVQTVLGISGDLLQPELTFGMEFPTLSQDIESKVNNIINTDDMMNRQIIYMLALGRFYTPNYVNSGDSRSSELASMASSTLSSQLSNMLGQISDTWDIGTNIRSDQGDFSDVEVELALSSQLLNDRLIFNGSFGYSETYVTSSSFIGDFDLEYLLNKSGNVRLKAYNHYNDRNYYTKSDLTTQGVGVLVKRDFNHFSEVIDWVGSSISNAFKSVAHWIKGEKREEEELRLDESTAAR